jgi:hypothetical protein
MHPWVGIAGPVGSTESRSAVSIVMNRTRPTGRHRLGRPGLIPVSALVTVVRRGFLRSWWRPARHRYVESPATRRVGVRAPAAA